MTRCCCAWRRSLKRRSPGRGAGRKVEDRRPRSSIPNLHCTHFVSGLCCAALPAEPHYEEKQQLMPPTRPLVSAIRSVLIRVQTIEQARPFSEGLLGLRAVSETVGISDKTRRLW